MKIQTVQIAPQGRPMNLPQHGKPASYADLPLMHAAMLRVVNGMAHVKPESVLMLTRRGTL